MTMSELARRRILVWILLAAVMAAAAIHRADRYKDRPLFHPCRDSGFFYTEEAFQFRYARMVAYDEPVPLLDKKAQWPDGLSPFRELTLFQEYLHGRAFRLFSALGPPVSFHLFLIYFVSFFSSLTILALFLGARAIGAEPWPALFCAVLYAFTGAAFARTQFYELESTAFPLMALSFVSYLYALGGRRYSLIAATLAGGLLALALITWHFTRFYLLVFWVAVAVAWLRAGSDRRRFFAAGLVLACAALTAALSPVMRVSGLIWSPAMTAGVLVVAGLYFDHLHGFNGLSRALWLAVGAAAIVMAASCGGETQAYGHVWDLLRYKIGNLLIKPADPADLPLAGRFLWYGPFNTPSFHFLFYRYGLALPLALIALWRLMMRRPGPDGRRRLVGFEDMVVIIAALGFLAANIMVQRLTIFGAFFLGLAVAYLFVSAPGKTPETADDKPTGWRRLKKNRWLWPVLLICLALQIRESVCDRSWLAQLVNRAGSVRPSTRLVTYAGDHSRRLDWIRDNTPEEAVFLANQGDSPSILTDTGRAINLHPKLETAGAREKVATALFTLFGEDEEALYRLLDAWETDYYLYAANNLLDSGPDSERYLAGISRLSRRNLIYRLHFEPDGFRRLRLVYRDRSHQIYRVLDNEGDETAGAGYAPPYFPVYDPACFGPRGTGPGGVFDDAWVSSVVRRLDDAVRLMNQAGEQLARGDHRMALEAIHQALTIGMPDGQIYSRAADYLLRLDRPGQALAYIRQALACDPDNGQYRQLLERILSGRGRNSAGVVGNDTHP